MNSPVDFWFSPLSSYESMSFDSLLSDRDDIPDEVKSPVSFLFDDVSLVSPTGSSAYEPVQFLEAAEPVEAVALDRLGALSQSVVRSLQRGKNSGSCAGNINQVPAGSLSNHKVHRVGAARLKDQKTGPGSTQFSEHGRYIAPPKEKKRKIEPKPKRPKWTEEALECLRKEVKALRLPSIPYHISGCRASEWENLSVFETYHVSAKQVRGRWFDLESDKIDKREKPIGDKEITYLEKNFESLDRMTSVWASISKLLYECNGRDTYIPPNRIKNIYNAERKKKSKKPFWSERLTTVVKKFLRS